MRVEYCRKHYSVTPRQSALRIEYWGSQLESASNIIFSNGLLDPWHRGGVLKSISDTVVAVLIKEGAHHLDLRGRNDADPSSVIRARKMEIQLIQQFIGDARKRGM